VLRISSDSMARRASGGPPRSVASRQKEKSPAARLLVVRGAAGTAGFVENSRACFGIGLAVAATPPLRSARRCPADFRRGARRTPDRTRAAPDTRRRSVCGLNGDSYRLRDRDLARPPRDD
jgi:hypothetical protein